jgi:ribosomal protein L21
MGLFIIDHHLVDIGRKEVAQGKGKKILVYKKKRRKGYEKLRGHRQQYTEIKIGKITL